MSDVVVDVLLAIGVTAQLVCCAGVAVMRTTADRLHYTSAGFTLGPLAVVAALVVREGPSSVGLDGLAAAGLLIAAGPVVTHATARALRRVDFDRIEARPEERIK